MIKSIYTFGICLAIGLSSCSGSIEGMASDLEDIADEAKDEMEAEPTIVGDWGLSDFDLGTNIPEDKKELFANMKKEMIAYSTVTYNADGTYTQNDMMQGQIITQTGTYSFDGDKLTTAIEGGDETITHISKLTETEVAFSIDDNGNTLTMTYTRK